jgi:hypothetical protein
MIELFLVACLLREPARCESHHVPTEPMSLVGCMVASQQYLVRWQADHPTWQVRRWTCGLPRA